MNSLTAIYSLGLVTAGFLLVAGIVEGARWAVGRWQFWSVRRECNAAAREWEQEQRRIDREQIEWRRGW